MNRHDQQPVSSSCSALPLSLSAPEALQQVLGQAQQDCQAQQWLKVIERCEAVIEQCHDYLHRDAALASDPLAAMPSPEPMSELASGPDAGPNLPRSLSDLHQVKGDLFRSEGQTDRAIQAYQQALRHPPEQGEVHAKLAELYAHQGQSEDAIAHYQKAVALSPSLPKAHAELALLQAQQQQWHEAIAHYQQALAPNQGPSPSSQLALSPALSPDQQAKIRLELGRAHFELGQQLKGQGKIEAAVRAYLQALQEHPRLFEVYNRLRYNLMRYEIAHRAAILNEIVSTCEQIVEQFPNLVQAHVTLGYALTKQGKREAAIERYRSICDRTIRRQHPDPQLWEKAERRGPDYIIIGAEKSGTSSLYHYLRRHPAMLPPIEKEIDFFDMEYDQGLNWYLAHFPPMPQSMPQSMPPSGNWLTGETSANYLYSQAAPQRILEHFPKVKLIVLLRDPIERTVSRYNMMVRNGAEKRSFKAAIQQEIQRLQMAIQGDKIHWQALNGNRHLGNSLYYYHLKRWLDYFPREQLLIVPSEALFNQPEKMLHQLYIKLGLEPNPQQEYPQYNAGSYEPIDTEIRQLLADFLTPPTRKLETLLDCSFNWSL